MECHPCHSGCRWQTSASDVSEDETTSKGFFFMFLLVSVDAEGNLYGMILLQVDPVMMAKVSCMVT